MDEARLEDDGNGLVPKSEGWFPPGAKHAFVGAGGRPFLLLCVSSRRFQKDGPGWLPSEGGVTVSEP